MKAFFPREDDPPPSSPAFFISSCFTPAAPSSVTPAIRSASVISSPKLEELLGITTPERGWFPLDRILALLGIIALLPDPPVWWDVCLYPVLWIGEFVLDEFRIYTWFFNLNWGSELSRMSEDCCFSGNTCLLLPGLLEPTLVGEISGSLFPGVLALFSDTNDLFN